MRIFTFKGLLLTTVFMLLGCLSIQAADDGLITEQITVNLDKAGTLEEKIKPEVRSKITNLKIVGEVNGTDWKLIRNIAGSRSTGYGSIGKLSVLDLSEAKIVEGGDSYYNDVYIGEFYTSNDCVGGYAFAYCNSLTSIDLPSTITKIDYRAFQDCRNLKNVNIHAGITSISKGAFQNCDRLEKINIPIGITEIKEKTFYNCSALKTINIPEGVTRIEDYAFDGIQFLLSVTFPSTLQYLSVYALCDSFNSSYLTAYFYGKKPPVVSHRWSIDYRTVIYVPKGTAEDYYMVLKGAFPVDRNQIVEFDATGIDKVTISTDTKEVSRYSVNGQRLSAPTKGLNIVKYSDGSVKKVAVQ